MFVKYGFNLKNKYNIIKSFYGNICSTALINKREENRNEEF